MDILCWRDIVGTVLVLPHGLLTVIAMTNSSSVYITSIHKQKLLFIVDMLLDSRVTVDGSCLTISSVKKTDTQMLQCNASNIHGYLLASAHLNIQGNTVVSCCKKIYYIIGKNDKLCT